MSKLEELIQELCPDRVEYKVLDELCDIVTKQTGFDYTKHIKDALSREKTSSNIPYIQTKFFSGEKFDYNTDYYIPLSTAELYPKILLDRECILLSIVGASIGNIGYFSGKEKCFLGGAICVIKPKIMYNAKYIFYYLSSTYGQKQIFQKVKGAGQATVTIKDIRNFSIPIPPLPVQAEIVRILDNFTEFTTELATNLKAELIARKKQYEYYRENMLTFDDDIKRTTLQDICTKISSGGTPKSTNSNYYGGDIPWLRTQEVDWDDIYNTEVKITQEGLENSSAKWIPKDCLIIAMYGATAAKVAINKIPLTTNQACCNLQINTEIADLRYVFHWMSKEYVNLKEMGQGSQSNINAGIIKKYQIPLPKLAEQKRIADSLDRLSLLTNNIETEILREIENRRVEYEYYRNKILSFENTSGEDN